MSEFRDRFEGFSPEERARLVAELESQITVRGKRLLRTPELEELIQLLPAGHFKRCFKAGIAALRARREAFPDKLKDEADAVRRLTEHCFEGLASADAAAREPVLGDMAALR